MPKMDGVGRSVLIAATFLIACADGFQARAVGGLPLWTNYYGQTGVGVAVAVDRAGNAFVTGFDYTAFRKAGNQAGQFFAGRQAHEDRVGDRVQLLDQVVPIQPPASLGCRIVITGWHFAQRQRLTG